MAWKTSQKIKKMERIFFKPVLIADQNLSCLSLKLAAQMSKQKVDQPMMLSPLESCEPWQIDAFKSDDRAGQNRDNRVEIESSESREKNSIGRPSFVTCRPTTIPIQSTDSRQHNQLRTTGQVVTTDFGYRSRR